MIKIPDDMARPGDMMDVVYDVKPNAPTGLVNLAIRTIKDTLSSDPRLTYQSGRWDEGFDIYQVPYRRYIVRVEIRETPRGQRPQIQKAGALYSMVAIFALASAAVVAYSAAMVCRYVAIVRVAENASISPAAKEQALNELGKSPLTAGNLAVGGIGAAAVLVVGLWLLLRRSGAP